MDGHPRKHEVGGGRAGPRRSRYALPAVTLCVGVLLSCVLFLAVRGRQQREAEQALERAAADRIGALRTGAAFDALVVRSLISFYAGSEAVERSEFLQFTQLLFPVHPDVQALAWAPRVADAERPGFEERSRGEGVSDFRITEKRSDGALVPAARRQEYFPICFVARPKGNEAFLGYDLASEEACRQAMDRARDTSELAATERITLVRDDPGHDGFMVFGPVFRQGARVETVQERRENLQGFVLRIVRIEECVEEALSELAPAGVDIHIYDESAPVGRQHLYSHYSRTRQTPHEGPPAKRENLERDPHAAGTLVVSGRQWRVLCTAAPALLEAHDDWQPWALLAAGLSISLLLSGRMVSAARSASRGERLLHELARANEELLAENENRLAAERKLEESRAFLQSVIDAVPEPMMVIGLDHRVVYANLTARKPTDGVDPAANHMACHQVSHRRETPCDGADDACPLQEVARTKAPVTLLHTHYDAAGNESFVEIRAAPIFDEAGEVVQIVEACQDVTEQKRWETTLARAKEAAEAANRAKSEFLANMSHEIRTPMTAILGYADLLTDPQLSPSERDAHLAVIRRNGEHLLTLINDILDLSKIEAGKMAVDLTPCNLPSVLAGVASILRVRADQRGIALSVEYATPVPETIRTDASRLRQALVNLVGNAVKFSEGGAVRIVAALLEDWRDGRAAVRLEVIDTGVGIAQEKLSALFEPFVQADASTSRRFGGTGLGLAITRRIAEMLGGELTVRSAAGEGSTFTLIVPTGPLEGVAMLERPGEAMLSDGRDPKRQSARPNALAGLRVLLAEDGPDNQLLIKTLLARAGAQVEIAENGRLAVEKARAAGPGGFDVVLMDMQMPEMDGYEAVGALRESGYGGPIVALTAHSMAGDRDKCVEAGCDDYLTKPVDPGRLIDVAAKWASGKKEAIASEFANDPDLASILDTFVEALPEKVAAMRLALGGGQHDELRRLAHQLKGAGGGYGYPSLTEAARALEAAADARDVEGAGLALGRLAALGRGILEGRPKAPVPEENER